MVPINCLYVNFVMFHYDFLTVDYSVINNLTSYYKCNEIKKCSDTDIACIMYICDHNHVKNYTHSINTTIKFDNLISYFDKISKRIDKEIDIINRASHDVNNVLQKNYHEDISIDIYKTEIISIIKQDSLTIIVIILIGFIILFLQCYVREKCRSMFGDTSINRTDYTAVNTNL